MMKYMVYRAPEESEHDLRKLELIGVEYGNDIYDVTDALIHIVTTDLSEDPAHAGCFDVCAHGPDPMQEFYQTTKGRQYGMTGSLAMPGADENTLVEYSIIETEES